MYGCARKQVKGVSKRTENEVNPLGQVYSPNGEIQPFQTYRSLPRLINLTRQCIHSSLCESMGNVLSNRRRSEWSDQKTSSRWSCSTAEMIVYIYFFNRIYPNENIAYSPAYADFSYEKPIGISRTLRLIHDGISFAKILPKPICYFELKEWTENNLRK
jgi:hypothetical protein